MIIWGKFKSNLVIKNGFQYVTLRMIILWCTISIWAIATRHVKVKLSLYLTKHHIMGEWRHSSTHSLISALDGGEWSASRSAHFTPRERVFFTHWIGEWVVPRAGLNTVSKRKILSPRRVSNPDHPIFQPTARILWNIINYTLLNNVN